MCAIHRSLETPRDRLSREATESRERLILSHPQVDQLIRIYNCEFHALLQTDRELRSYYEGFRIRNNGRPIYVSSFSPIPLLLAACHCVATSLRNSSVSNF